MATDEESRIMDALADIRGDITHLRNLLDGGNDPSRGPIVRMASLEQWQIVAADERKRHDEASWRREGTVANTVIAVGAAIIGSLTLLLLGLWIYRR